MAVRRAPLLAALACVTACSQTLTGTAVRSAPEVDEHSRSPVDVDTVLLARDRLQAITGAGQDLTPIPGMDGKRPVDVTGLADAAPPPCRWYFAETETFGTEVEEFHKTTYQDPPASAQLSQGAAGYRDPATARRAFDALAALVDRCAATAAGPVYVGEWTADDDAITTRTARCGRDYRLKSVVLAEVTWCGYPDSVPDIVLTNMLARVPG